MPGRKAVWLWLLLCVCVGSLPAQTDKWLDPTRGLAVQPNRHTPLPEQYIWTAGDAAALSPNHDRYNFASPGKKAAPHYFRYAFSLKAVPSAATLYVAGPRSARIYANGRLVDDVKSDLVHPLGMHVFRTDITRALRPGRNVLALEVVRGRGITSVSNSRLVQQLALGEVLVAKVLSGADAKALAISGPDWTSTLAAAPGWEQPGFDDSHWQKVQTLGGIESSPDMFQWNIDAGLYDWPGYEGVSPFLRHYSLKPAKVLRVFEGRSRFANMDSLMAKNTASFGVKLSASLLPDQLAPSVMLDFGREVAGRLEVRSDSGSDALVTIQYGESEDEAEAGGHYLGTNLLRIPKNGVAWGPKSAFRYAKVRFVGGGPELRFHSIQLDGIYYPVEYQGTFESSDPLLNRIWETGAYTAHLCMQDGLWDAPKRDRGRWVGDVDIEGRVISRVFGDRFLMESTLTSLIGESPVRKHINNIPSFSPLWITSLYDHYRQTGAKDYLAGLHPSLLELLKLMDSSFDGRNMLGNPTKGWLFADWSPGLWGDVPEVRRITQMGYYRGYVEGAYLLREMGDHAAAEQYEQRAAAIKAAANRYLRDADGTYGPRWQTNAAAIVSGVAAPEQYPVIWEKVLKSVRQDQPDSQAVSPYYNYYVVTAMAKAGHPVEALNWMREYWGGMLKQGATSFWENYDLRWPKNKAHFSLQADGTSGFFVSMAHGWSAGPTVWLMEHVLGINTLDAGYRHVTIRPDLMDLAWAKGTVPTPQGPIRIAIEKAPGRITLEIPSGVSASVLVPVSGPQSKMLVNGEPVPSKSAENGSRALIDLNAGRYEIRAE